MLEIPIAALLAFIGAIAAAVIGGLVTLMLQRRKQPAEDAPSVIALSNQLIALALTHAKTISEQATSSVEQVRQSGVKDATIAALIADRDGLPVRVAELTARALLDAGYMETLQKMLELKGVARSDQPIKPEPEPLTPLNPANLLDKLAEDKRARESGDAKAAARTVVVSPPARIEVVQKPPDSPATEEK